MNNHLNIKGNLNIKLYRDGVIKDERNISNAITNAGLYSLLDQSLASPTLAKIGWMAIGTGTPTATLLGAEVDRKALTSKTRDAGVLVMACTWAAGEGTGAITEAGLFDVVTANTVNMLAYSSFDAIDKLATDILDITWTWTLTTS